MARDIESWMWLRACAALDYADPAARSSFQPRGGAGQPGWEPPIDLLETPDSLWIIVAMPGVDVSTIEVMISGGSIEIAGIRPIPSALKGAAIHRMEIPYGRFERHVGLPAGRFELERRHVADGCLTLSLRKLG
ncbi:MAG TPA: Hsp20/alpha crystallin family protein [Stellaceae bacterium]|nr:Hsp20/alpha crystallin family protein [Stellaceae bacterium]